MPAEERWPPSPFTAQATIRGSGGVHFASATPCSSSSPASFAAAKAVPPVPIPYSNSIGARVRRKRERLKLLELASGFDAPDFLQARLLPAGGRLLDLGRGSGLAGIPSRCTATPGKTSRLPASSVHVGNLALRLAHERHIVRGDFPIGNNRSRRRGHHVRPGISNGAHGLGSSRDGRP
jgi:hypothetical protein